MFIKIDIKCPINFLNILISTHLARPIWIILRIETFMYTKVNIYFGVAEQLQCVLFMGQFWGWLPSGQKNPIELPTCNCCCLTPPPTLFGSMGIRIISLPLPLPLARPAGGSLGLLESGLASSLGWFLVEGIASIWFTSNIIIDFHNCHIPSLNTWNKRIYKNSHPYRKINPSLLERYTNFPLQEATKNIPN